MSQPFCCPVCAGKGLVPAQFYQAVGVADTTAYGTAPEVCRSCQGTGVLWQAATPEGT